MFESRLKFLLIAFTAGLLIILVRLTDLQIVHASYYRQRAERSLILRPKPLPFVRGRIVDRRGEVLVADEPCWDLTIDYDAIAADIGNDKQALGRLAREWRQAGAVPRGLTGAALTASLKNELADMWGDIDSFLLQHWYRAEQSSRERCRDIYERVSGIREAVARRRGFDAAVHEEKVAHTLMPALDAQQQIAARERFERYPWIRVERSSVRRYAQGTEAMAHLLGRTGRVSPDDIENDPNAEDPFASYEGDEDLGVSGVERLAEPILRGRRGQMVTDRDGKLVPSETIDAQNGRDAVLTIDARLQRRLYDVLGKTVHEIPASSGGAIVVLDAQTREVLALVSYPGYDPNRFDQDYAALRDDTTRLPLRFRAVANRYAPGSTIKPLVCLGGLAYGVITRHTTVNCTGYLFPNQRDRWRCWQIHGSSARMAHGPVNVVSALKGSCNIFMYHLGQDMGVDMLCSVFDMVGIGRLTGIGLAEEVPGINPTPSWLETYKNIRPTPGLARLYAIGQGEVSLTPIQVANMMATYATGMYGGLTLVGSGDKTPKNQMPGDPKDWLAVRRGMYGVVNAPDGTAYRQAHFENPRYVLIGKTGSATAYPWPTAYDAKFVDVDGVEKTERVPAGSLSDAMERLRRLHPDATFDPNNITVATRWPTVPPTSGEHHSHAWFAGYLQARHPDGSPDWSVEPRIAFAALVEFGGSGGRTSGPLAKKVASAVLEVFGDDLDIPAQVVGGRAP